MTHSSTAEMHWYARAMRSLARSDPQIASCPCRRLGLNRCSPAFQGRIGGVSTRTLRLQRGYHSVSGRKALGRWHGMTVVRMVLAAIVLAGGLVSSGQVASAD